MQLIVKEFNLDGVKVMVEDTFLPKSEEERQQRYEIFNQIGCEILNSSE